MAILVTGGAGFIGSNLVDKLIEEKQDVIIWDNLSTGFHTNINKKAIFEDLDITANYLVERTLDYGYKFDAIFHLAALPRIQASFDNPSVTNHVNISGTQNMLEIARKCHVPVFIYAGSSSAYFDIHANPYAFTKWVGEEYCKLYKKSFSVDFKIARFFNVYGPKQDRNSPYATLIAVFEKKVLENLPLVIYGDGSKRRDFTHVYDIVSGLIAMWKDKKYSRPIYNLGSGHNYSVLEIAQMFQERQKNIQIVFKENKPGEAQETLADISDTMKELNWKPTYSVLDYINDFFDSIV